MTCPVPAGGAVGLGRSVTIRGQQGALLDWAGHVTRKRPAGGAVGLGRSCYEEEAPCWTCPVPQRPLLASSQRMVPPPWLCCCCCRGPTVRPRHEHQPWMKKQRRVGRKLPTT
ncbi:hypothetical protein CRUP_025259 [Coryphaenoides rupestris]|nr:hypothetical protein CRUP_025259 [Coryphaenoides rupestris]